jgi:hypothetical protein
VGQGGRRRQSDGPTTVDSYSQPHGSLHTTTLPTAPRLEMSGSTVLAALQTKIWAGRVPLEIRLAPQDCSVYDQTDPLIVSLSPPPAYLV